MTSQAPTSTIPVDDSAVPLPGTRQMHMDSTHTGHRHRILIALPSQPPPATGHPVVYLLDGNFLFPTATTLTHLAAHSAQRLGLTMAPPLVVAIGHEPAQSLFDPTRGENHTPPAPTLADTGDSRSPIQGGGDRFLDFIEHELKPRIQAQWPIDPRQQSLVGHSYGGLLALHALFTRTGAFQTYVAGSPSIWWNDGWILAERDVFLAARANPDNNANATSLSSTATQLLITVGELEQTPTAHLDGEARDSMIRQRRMVDGARELAQSLSADPAATGLRVAFRELPGANHIGAALPMLVAAFALLHGDTAQAPSHPVTR